MRRFEGSKVAVSFEFSILSKEKWLGHSVMLVQDGCMIAEATRTCLELHQVDSFAIGEGRPIKEYDIGLH
jgi:hypothetical protein